MFEDYFSFLKTGHREKNILILKLNKNISLTLNLFKHGCPFISISFDLKDQMSALINTKYIIFIH